MPSNKNTPLLRLRDQVQELNATVIFLRTQVSELGLRLSVLESRQVLFVNPPVSFPNYDPLTTPFGTGVPYRHDPGPTCVAPSGQAILNATNRTTESGICPPNKDIFG